MAAVFVANARAQITADRRAVHGKLFNALKRWWDGALRLAPRKVR